MGSECCDVLWFVLFTSFATHIFWFCSDASGARGMCFFDRGAWRACAIYSCTFLHKTAFLILKITCCAFRSMMEHSSFASFLCHAAKSDQKPPGTLVHMRVLKLNRRSCEANDPNHLVDKLRSSKDLLSLDQGMAWSNPLHSKEASWEGRTGEQFCDVFKIILLLGIQFGRISLAWCSKG